MKADLTLRQRIEARTEQPRQPFAPRPPFDASVRQADGIGACEPRRDVIGSVLLYKIDVTDRHPGLMLALAALVILAGLILEGTLP